VEERLLVGFIGEVSSRAAARNRELTGNLLIGSREVCDENRLIPVSSILRRWNLSNGWNGKGFQ
jgi:hypothetical protein